MERESLLRRLAGSHRMGESLHPMRTALLLTTLLLLMLVQPSTEMGADDDAADAGRQGVEAECEGLTFEDMFNYTHADFDIVINDDWASAYVRAVAWINGSLADDVRTDFDSLFEPVGSDNGWLSSDEYQMVRNIAAECVEQTNPRIGFRGGPAHRGGDGVNWYNASWENSDDHPMVLEEWNLMPMNHADERECQSSPNNDCVEIPTVPITGRDCDTTRVDPDECRMIIWLNATLNFDGLFGQPNDEFTVAMNTSNMTYTDLHITYPALDGLRVGLFEECDGRRIDQANNDNQGTAPYPGTCTSDNSIGTSSQLVNIGGETRLRVDTLVTYDMENWPTGQDMFFDMTTEPPETDDPPTWSSVAPAAGDIIPIADDGRVTFLSTDALGGWGQDDHGTPLVSCTGADGWGLESDADGLSADAPDGVDSTSMSCEVSDAGGQNSGVREFTLQVPFRVTGEAPHTAADLTFTPTEGMPSFQDLVVTLVQDDAQKDMSFRLGDEAGSVSMSLDEMSAGPFAVHVAATAPGVTNFGHTYDLGLSKSSAPPALTVSSGEWIDADFEITGMFSDPDGDSVSITATNNGLDWGTVLVSGNQWMANGAGIPDAEENEIVFTACDTWGACSELTHLAGATPGGGGPTTPPPVVKPPAEEGGLPGFGVLAALGAILLAGLGRRRED